MLSRAASEPNLFWIAIWFPRRSLDGCGIGAVYFRIESKCAPNKYDFRITKVRLELYLAVYTAKTQQQRQTRFGKQCLAPADTQTHTHRVLAVCTFIDSVSSICVQWPKSVVCSSLLWNWPWWAWARALQFIVVCGIELVCSTPAIVCASKIIGIFVLFSMLLIPCRFLIRWFNTIIYSRQISFNWSCAILVHNPDVRCRAAIQMKRESSRKSRGGRGKLAEQQKKFDNNNKNTHAASPRKRPYTYLNWWWSRNCFVVIVVCVCSNWFGSIVLL